MPDNQIDNNTESPRKDGNKGCGCLVATAIAVLVIIVLVTSLNEPAAPTQTGTSSSSSMSTAAKIEKVLITVNTKYEYGMFEVVGVAANGGNTELFSPTIVLEIYDETGKVKLDEQYAWPAGWYLKNVKPGEQAAFDIISMPAGEPDHIKWKVYVKDYPYEIVNGKKK
jgi:hypothetical protein